MQASPAGRNARLSCHGAPGTQRSTGLALIEVLVAFAILVVGLATLLPALSQGADYSTNAAMQTRATLLARRQIESASLDGELRPGERSGSEGAFTWRLSIVSYEDEWSSDAFGAPRLVAIASVVSWEEGRQDVRLDTLRMVAP
jgi:hypothetical protein